MTREAGNDTAIQQQQQKSSKILTNANCLPNMYVYFKYLHLFQILTQRFINKQGKLISAEKT